MTAENFCYWLQGYFEIENNQPRPPEYAPSLNSEQVKMIRNHLHMVFKHDIDPKMGDKEHQKALAELHKGIQAITGSGSAGGFDPKTMINC